jgi:hypothetical protein
MEMAMKQLAVLVNSKTGEFTWIDRSTMNSSHEFPLSVSERRVEKVAKEMGWETHYWLYLYKHVSFEGVRVVAGTHHDLRPQGVFGEEGEKFVRNLRREVHAPRVFVPRNEWDSGAPWGCSISEWVATATADWPTQ